jgi:TatD DNase family protein
MKFVDVHIHLADNIYEQKVREIVGEAKHLGISSLVTNSTDLETSKKNLKLAEEYPNHVFATLGIHPWNTKQLKPNEIQDTINLLFKNEWNREKVVGVGEIGLDSSYSGEGEPTKIQIKVFHEMLTVSEKTSLPVIIHSRGAANQIVNILSSYNIKKVLLHWFSQPPALLPKIIDQGYYISEGPASLYSSSIRDIIKQIPLKYFMTETDGPVRFRGPFKDKLTTPAVIPKIVEFVAQLKGKEKNEVADQIFNNFLEFFNMKAVMDKSNDEGRIDD